MKILILYNEDKYIELSMDQSYCFNEKLEQVRQGDIHIVSVNGEPVINHMTCEEFSNTNAFHIKAYELEAKEYAVSTVYLSEVSIGNDQDCNIIVDQEEPLLCVLSKRQLCFMREDYIGMVSGCGREPMICGRAIAYLPAK